MYQRLWRYLRAEFWEKKGAECIFNTARAVHGTQLVVPHLCYALRGTVPRVNAIRPLLKERGSYSDVFNPFPNKPLYLRVCSTSHLKTPWEKKKLLAPFRDLNTIFIKFKIVVCKLFQLRRVYRMSLGKGLDTQY